ncbi:hypothetical protein BCR36DRAFT_333467 [Piromyces finnis]|uniref:Uncharacterized protein n=1 Tax=Piromyces finnis TaxID=1754191 RepID=A0A1Y1V1H0_9FUNG|nr:hypothetical protein BCR36DRAFT_333467 [Piromyces finnis]|eukprot:ORX45175.1 hypothetical protein BCR36DRAFT_333467 [Piromyces finnis]
MENNKPHIDTTQVAISVSIDTPKSSAALSPLPNVPTFIKLFGKPETKEDKDNDWDDKIDGNKKSEVLDIIDASDEDPFTLESFISLIMLYVKNKKDFIISRVKTADPNDENKFYYSYYAAHHINKVIFRTQPEQSLLHRMRAKNPLNNMTIVDDVYYYVVKHEDAKKVIENIKNKLKIKDEDIKQKPPVSPLFITPLQEIPEENGEKPSTNGRNHIRSKSSPIQFVSNISNRAPRSIQRLLVRTGMAPLQAYPELMTRNNLRLIMKPEGLEPDPIMNSATVDNDEFNSDDLYEKALNKNKIFTKIRNTLGKKEETPKLEVIHEVFSSSVGLLEKAEGNDDINDENKSTCDTPISKQDTSYTTPSIVISDDDDKSKVNSDKMNDSYSQYVIDLGNSMMKNEKSTSPKSAISSFPYPAYSNHLLKVQTNSYLNDRDNKLSVYDWIKVHSTSPLSANNENFNKLFKNSNENDRSSNITDDTKNTDTTINIDTDGESNADTLLNSIKEIIFEAKFYATDDDFLMKSNVRAYFKHNALEPDDAVLFTLPSLDNVIMLDGEQHPALANFNYVLDRQMQNEARVLRKINKSLKWLLLAYLIFAFVLIKVWVPTNIVVIIIAIGIFLICFFLMICAI